MPRPTPTITLHEIVDEEGDRHTIDLLDVKRVAKVSGQCRVYLDTDDIILFVDPLHYADLCAAWKRVRHLDTFFHGESIAIDLSELACARMNKFCSDHITPDGVGEHWLVGMTMRQGPTLSVCNCEADYAPLVAALIEFGMLRAGGYRE